MRVQTYMRLLLPVLVVTVVVVLADQEAAMELLELLTLEAEAELVVQMVQVESAATAVLES